MNAYLAYLPIFFPQIDLTPYPNVQATIAATQARPAYQRSVGRQGLNSARGAACSKRRP